MQHYYLIATLARVARLTSSFTYHSEAQLPIGQLVEVEVGKKITTGVVINILADTPSFSTKPIQRILLYKPLPQALIDIATWLRDYYHSPETNVWQALLPAGVAKKRRKSTQPTPEVPLRHRTKIILNDEQQATLQTLHSHTTGTFLLQGITGSGKTQVYIEAAKKTMLAGQSVIVLVPEIALTSQLIAEFSQHFSSIIITHSTMTEAQRHVAWQQALEADEPTIVIGPRSALFSPLANLGLIIIDECHEPSYKQEQHPRYSALRTASILANYHRAKLILGSATPSIADRFLAEQSERPILRLTHLARANAVTPTVKVIDLKDRSQFTKHSFISNQLISTIQNSLDQKQQVLLFHNRRGSAPTTLCKECGWLALCPRCFLPLTLHADNFRLQCHLCNFTQPVPTSCPHCHATEVIHKGIGTKAIEEAVRRLFPKANIYRFDGDSHSSETVDRRYQDLYDGTIDIIIGTQIIAKGLDLPNLTTVGILQADSGLNLPDFQAGERVFQLISQVRGRVGRSAKSSTLIVQSYQPNDLHVQTGIAQDYEAFYSAALAERERRHFPPFCHLLKLTTSYKTERAAITAAKDFARKLRTAKLNITILGPAPAFYERLRDTYRWQLIVKSSDRRELVNALKLLPPQQWQYELDPTSLL